MGKGCTQVLDGFSHSTTPWVPVLTDKGQHAPAVVSTARENLVDCDLPTLKGCGGSRRVQQPDSVSCFRNDPQQRFPVSLEAVHPIAQGQLIVFAQVLDVAHFETGNLCAAFSSKVTVAEQPLQVPKEPIKASSKVPLPFLRATTLL